jgi:hypothetical protein
LASHRKSKHQQGLTVAAILKSYTENMGLNYKCLDFGTRLQMIEEFNYDTSKNCVYYSKRFTTDGEIYYRESMIGHLTNGTDDSLSENLKDRNCFKDFEDRTTAKGTSRVKVPITASQTFSEGEFNRFYIRAMCNRAILENRRLIVYRARHSETPRQDSEILIGKLMDPHQLLFDLRNNIGLDTILGLPPGPNSGLSIEFSAE